MQRILKAQRADIHKPNRIDTFSFQRKISLPKIRRFLQNKTDLVVENEKEKALRNACEPSTKEKKISLGFNQGIRNPIAGQLDGECKI